MTISSKKPTRKRTHATLDTPLRSPCWLPAPYAILAIRNKTTSVTARMIKFRPLDYPFKFGNRRFGLH